MVEFGYNDPQVIQAGGSAILQNIRPCAACPQRVMHDDLTANVILRGISKAPCRPYAEYNVRYSGNIAVPTGGTAGEIQLALSLGGEVLPLTIAAATPAAAGDYWHVSGEAAIRVPCGCCSTITVKNASVSADPSTTPASAVSVRNLNVTVSAA